MELSSDTVMGKAQGAPAGAGAEAVKAAMTAPKEEAPDAAQGEGLDLFDIDDLE
jgi:hypothetical protein